MRKLTGFFFLFFSVTTLAQESLFTLLDNSETGIDFSNDLVDTKQHSIFLYANYYGGAGVGIGDFDNDCLLYTSPSPRDKRQSRMPSSA